MKNIFLLLSACNILFINTLLAQNGLYTYDMPAGYTYAQLNFRNAIYANNNGDVWVGFKQIGLGKFDGTTWQMYNTGNSCLPSNNVLSLGKYGSANVAGTDNGLVFLNSGCSVMNTTNSGIPDNSINCISVAAGLLCVGTNSGIGVYNGSSWNIFNQANSGLVNDTIEAIHYSGNGLLVCTKGGVAKYNGTNWTNATGLTVKNATSIALDQMGRYWIHTKSLNVYMLLNNTIILPSSQYPEFDKLIFNSTLFLAENQSGEIFLSKFNGIHKIGTTIHSYYLPNVSMSSAKCSIDNSGNIWIINLNTNPLINNLFKFNPSTYIQELSGNSFTTTDNLKYLDVNKVKALYTATAISHWSIYQNINYEVPQGQDKNTLLISSFWIAGKTNTENFWRSSCDRYLDFKINLPGPLRLTDGGTDSSTAAQFEKIWKVNRFDVENFIAHYAAGNVQNGTYAIPESIVTWPGNGPAGYDPQLAPYVDVNSDGIYNPYDGDYPKIKGDQMLWWVLNDQLTASLDSVQSRIGLEVRISAHAYVNNSATSSDSVINYITFLTYEFINRSANQYDSLLIGFNSDADIGYAQDDYVGSCVDRSFYFYNSDLIDAAGGAGTPGDYGPCPPIQTITLLKDPVSANAQNSKLNGFTYYNNSSGPQGNPSFNTMDFVNYLSGRWKDGSPLVYGGTGYQGSGGATNIPANFMFPHNSDVNFSNTGGINPGFNWSELLPAPGLPRNAPGDRRGVGRLGPYTFAPGEKKTVEWAFVTHFWPCGDTITLQMEKTCAFNQQLIDWYDNNSFPSGLDLSNVSVKNETNQDGSLQVFPNPFAQNFAIAFKTPQNSKFSYRILDIAGREMMKSVANQFDSDGSTYQIDASGLANGVYIVEVGSGQTSERKIIVKAGK